MILSTLVLLGAPAIGLGLSCTAPNGAVVLVQEPLALHPADAAVLFQIPDVRGALQAYNTTAYGRILADVALHEALGRIMGAPGPVDPRDLALEQWGQAVANGAPPVDRIADALASFSFSVSVPDGDLAGFFEQLETAEDAEALAAGAFTLRALLEFHDEEGAAAMVSALKQAAEQQGQALVVEELPAVGGALGAGAAERISLPGDDGPFASSLRLVAGGKRLFLLAGAEPEATALARLAGTAATADGEAATGATVLAAARKGFDAASGAVLFEAHITPFVERMLVRQEPMALPALDLAEGLFGPLASMLLRGGDWRVRIDGGQFVTEGTYPKPAASPLSGLFGGTPLAPEDLALVMPDAIVAGAVSMDKNVLMRLFTSIVEEQGAQAMLDEIESAFGFRFDRDLIAPLGDALAYSLPPLTSLLSAPPFTVSFDIADLDTFTKGMDGVFSLLEAQAADRFQLKREEYKGVRLYTLSFAGAENAGGGTSPLDINPAALFRPTIAIGQGRAFLITTPNYAKKEVRRVEKLAGELELHPAFAGAALAKGTTEVGYADWADFFGRLYSGVKGLAPMLGGLTGDLPFDLSSLPDGEVITKHFQPSRRTKRIDGGVVRVHGRSSFGPELPIVAAIGGGGMAYSNAAMAAAIEDGETYGAYVPVGDGNQEVGVPPPMPVEEPSTGPDAELLATKDTLLTLKVDLTVYRFDHGKYPADLAALGHASANDGWGRAIVYKLTQNAFTLYSLGPNGVDDGGAGDDILPQD
jgi:hypothetical protein